MATDGVGTTNTTTGAAAQTSVNTSRTTIANNFNTFLQLLTTQLRAQNPLQPLDTNEFTQQLVQFASVEQQIQTNSTLASLLAVSDQSKLSQSVGYIGKTIVADGSEAKFQDGKAKWELDAAAAAPNSVVTVLDEKGNEVYSQRVSLSAGKQTFTWNGQTAEGKPTTGSNFKLTVTGQDAQSKPVSVKMQVEGKVDGVYLEGSETILTLGTTKVRLSQLTSVKA